MSGPLTIADRKKQWYLEAKSKMDQSTLWCFSLDGSCKGKKNADGVFVHDPHCSLLRQVREYAKYAAAPQSELEFTGGDQVGS